MNIATLPTDTAARARRIMRTSFVGIAANVLLAAFKAAVGLAAGAQKLSRRYWPQLPFRAPELFHTASTTRSEVGEEVSSSCCANGFFEGLLQVARE